MDNSEKLGHRVHKTKANKTKTQHNMCWTPPYPNKHKQCKQDMSSPTNNLRLKRSITKYIYLTLLYAKTNCHQWGSPDCWSFRYL